MPKFRVNKRVMNPGTNHEVHKEGCKYYNSMTKYAELGQFMFCSTALQTARLMGFTHVDGCKECCPECHRG